jgi:hypothetical protein
VKDILDLRLEAIFAAVWESVAILRCNFSSVGYFVSAFSFSFVVFFSSSSSCRVTTTGRPPVEAALDKFAYKSTSFKPPFRDPRSLGTTGVVTTGAYGVQEKK